MSNTHDVLFSTLADPTRRAIFERLCREGEQTVGAMQPLVGVEASHLSQQLAVLRRMVADLAIPVEIVGHPTIREPDGLAMSSRNILLTPDERKQADADRLQHEAHPEDQPRADAVDQAADDQDSHELRCGGDRDDKSRDAE